MLLKQAISLRNHIQNCQTQAEYNQGSSAPLSLAVGSLNNDNFRKGDTPERNNSARSLLLTMLEVSISDMTQNLNKEPDEKEKQWQLNVLVLVNMKSCCEVHPECCNMLKSWCHSQSNTTHKSTVLREGCVAGEASNLNSPKIGPFY
jgi:hypothetical protein